MEIDYGIPVEIYLDALKEELANIPGNTNADKSHRTDVQAEIAAVEAALAAPAADVAPDAVPDAPVQFGE